MSRQRTKVRDETRDRLISVAMELFLEQGYSNTSVQNIVDSAECTKGAFYYHFRAKDDLVLLAHEVYLDKQLAHMRGLVEADGSYSERLRKLMTCMVEGVVENRASVALFVEQRRFLRGDRFAGVREQRDEFISHLEDMLEAGIARGEFRSVANSQVLALGIIGMLTWTYQWLRADGELSPENVGALFGDLVMNGLRALT